MAGLEDSPLRLLQDYLQENKKEEERGRDVLTHQIYCIDQPPEEEKQTVEFYIHTILQQAVISGASDIHFDPEHNGLTVKYRIDGYLSSIRQVAQEYQPQLINRLKVMAEMDITERRLPQDGHMTVLFQQQTLDIRVSSLPTFHGEKIVLRLLHREKQFTQLEQLGFSTKNLQQIELLLQIPYGIVLVTGPTGSGKTTTLYSMLKRLTGRGKNMITLEDPVEYQIAEVNQVQINEKIGLTFATGLRSILRQDPDIVMVGEIRDRESAEIAVRLAYTGHLVLASLHTNDAFSAVFRLLDMGVEPYLLAGCLNGVIAQRLLRRWNGTAFQGRLAIQEVLFCDERLQQAILHGEQLLALKKEYLTDGFYTMEKDGWDKAEQGLTTREEVQLTLGVSS